MGNKRKPDRRSKRSRILSQLGDKNIVLLGMMGCGKSAIGKMLATRLGLEFRDADNEIEAAAGRSVADIFSDYGEPEFRRLENRVIERVLQSGPLILALGGGAFLSAQTRETIAKNSISVWMQADIDTLVDRVSRRPGKRPLLKNGNTREIIAGLLEKRSPVYALADIHVQTPRGTKANSRDAVLTSLEQFMSSRQTEQA